MKKIARSALAALLLLHPALVYADGVGQIEGVITSDFGAPVKVSAPTSGQVLVYNSTTGTWVAGTSAGPTTSTWSQVLTNGSVTGGVRPTVSAGDWMDFANSAAVAVSGANTGRLIYNSSTQTFQVSLNGAAFVNVATGTITQTLQAAYDGGNTISTTSAIAVTNNAANNNSLLTLNKSPAGAQSGSVLTITRGANASGQAINITDNSTQGSSCVFIGQGASALGTALQVTCANSSSIYSPLVVSNAGTAPGIQISQTGNGTGLSIANSTGNTNSMLAIGQASGATGTILDITSTWNAGGTTFRAIELSVTDTASAAASTLLRLRAGASGTTEVFSINSKGGAVITTPSGDPGSGLQIYDTTSGDPGHGILVAVTNQRSGNDGYAGYFQNPAATAYTGRATIFCLDTTATATGVGGGVLFGGKNSGGNTAPFASLNGSREAGGSTGALVFFCNSAGGTSAVAEKARIPSSGGFNSITGGVIGWTSSASDSTTLDTGLSRSSAGVVAFGTGSGGSAAGSWTATRGTLTSGSGIPLTVTNSATGGGFEPGIYINQTGANPYHSLYVSSTNAGSGNDVCQGVFTGPAMTGYGSRGTLMLIDTTTTAVGVGAGVQFWGKRAGNNNQALGAITGALDADNTNGALVFWTQNNGTTVTLSEKARFNKAGDFTHVSGTVVGWASSSSDSTTADTGLSRDSAGVVDFGTGAQGSTAGSIKLTNATFGGTGLASWGTGGSPSATSPQIKGPTDAGLFISAGGPASGAGNLLTITGGPGGSTGSGGGVTINGGVVTSAGNGGTITLAASNAVGGGSVSGGNVTITCGNSVGSSKDGGAFSVTAGNGAATTSVGGACSLTAGAGGATTGNGGAVNLTGGAAKSTGGNTGGAINITAGGAGNGSASTNIGGAVNITAGAGGTASATGAGGALVFAGGAGGSTSGTGGAASFTAGAGAGSTSGAGGLTTIAGGAGSTASNNNNAGGVTITTGLPSGTGTADLVLQSGFALASGSTAQTTYDRLRISSKTKALSTTTNTNTVFLNMSNAVSDSAVGCTVTGTIEVIDATGHHVGVIHFTVPFSCSNKNGTCGAGAVPVLGTSNGSINDDSTFTNLTTTFTSVVSGTNLTIGVTPTWSAGTPTTCRITYSVIANGQTTLSPQ